MIDIEINQNKQYTDLYEIKIILTDRLLFDFIETRDVSHSKELIMRLVSSKVDDFFYKNCPKHLVPSQVLMDARKCRVVIYHD